MGKCRPASRPQRPLLSLQQTSLAPVSVPGPGKLLAAPSGLERLGAQQREPQSPREERRLGPASRAFSKDAALSKRLSRQTRTVHVQQAAHEKHSLPHSRKTRGTREKDLVWILLCTNLINKGGSPSEAISTQGLRRSGCHRLGGTHGNCPARTHGRDA